MPEKYKKEMDTCYCNDIIIVFIPIELVKTLNRCSIRVLKNWAAMNSIEVRFDKGPALKMIYCSHKPNGMFIHFI